MDTKSSRVNAKRTQTLEGFDIGITTFTATRVSRWFVRAGAGESLWPLAYKGWLREKPGDGRGTKSLRSRRIKALAGR